MIEKVATHIEAPLIVGGGITDPEKSLPQLQGRGRYYCCGQRHRKDDSLIKEMSAAIHSVPVIA